VGAVGSAHKVSGKLGLCNGFCFEFGVLWGLGFGKVLVGEWAKVRTIG
jgi:hypothetical protein